MKKEFENILKTIEYEDKEFSSQRRDWENLNKITSQSLLMFYFHQEIVKK